MLPIGLRRALVFSFLKMIKFDEKIFESEYD
jgi:hypothetical protein